VKSAHERILKGHNVIYVNVKALTAQLQRLLVYLQAVCVNVPFRRSFSLNCAAAGIALSDGRRVAPLPISYGLNFSGRVGGISFSFIFTDTFARRGVPFRVIARSALACLAVYREAYRTVRSTYQSRRYMSVFARPTGFIVPATGGARRLAQRPRVLLTFGECHV